MKEKVILISGANRGIGLAIAQALHKEAYQLSLGIRDTDSMKTQDFSKDTAKVLLSYYDANHSNTATSWVNNTINQFGRIDAVINCAGIFLDCSLENFNETNLDNLWNINTKAPIFLTKEAWPYLKKTGEGRVINVVSLAGKFAQGANFAYSLSKHALLAFTHSIRQAGWDDGIRATAICPGWVNTQMAASCQLDPMSMTQPEEIASMIKMLLTLPNSASIAELSINCERHDLF